MMNFPALDFVRTLRTQSSEPFLVRSSGRETAALYSHYLADGSVQTSLIGFEEAGFSTDDIPGLLQQFDEILLPAQSLDGQNPTFTVVVGRVLGACCAAPE